MGMINLLMPKVDIARNMRQALHSVDDDIARLAAQFEARAAQSEVLVNGAIDISAGLVRPTDPLIKETNKLVTSKLVKTALYPKGLREELVPAGVREARAALEDVVRGTTMTKAQLKDPTLGMEPADAVETLRTLQREFREAVFQLDKPEVKSAIKEAAPVRKVATLGRTTALAVTLAGTGVAVTPEGRDLANGVIERFKPID